MYIYTVYTCLVYWITPQGRTAKTKVLDHQFLYYYLTDTLVLVDANNGTVRQTQTQGSIKIDFPSDWLIILKRKTTYVCPQLNLFDSIEIVNRCVEIQQSHVTSENGFQNINRGLLGIGGNFTVYIIPILVSCKA